MTFNVHIGQLNYLKLFYGLVFIIFAGQAVAETEKEFTFNTTLKPPLGAPDQNGFVDKIATQAFSRVGLKIRSIAFPAQRALLDANAGILDGELARVDGLEKFYKNLRKVPEKLFDVEFTVFSIKHSEINPGWGGLENKAIAFLNGWKILERNVPPSAEITKVESPQQLFQLLKMDRVDYIIYEKWGGSALAQSMKIEGVKLLSPPLAVRPLHMYLHKKHERYVQPLSDAIHQLKSEGTYQKYYEDILVPYSSKR